MPWYQTSFGLRDTTPEELASWGVSESSTLVPSYQRAGTGEVYQWDPGLAGREGYQAPEATMYTGSTLLQLLDKQQRGEPLSLAEQSQMQAMGAQLALPTRDWRQLTAPGGAYDETQRAQYPAIADPDYLAVLQQVHQAAAQGDRQAQALLPALREAQDQATFASTRKQDPFSPLGDPFSSALGILGLAVGGAGLYGAFAPALAAGAGGAASGAAAGGAAGASGSLFGVPLSTLSSLGTYGTYGGMGANLLGGLTGQDWLQKLGMGLGVAGGLSGGIAGIGGALQTGVNTLTQAAKLAGSVGRVSGALGTATGAGGLSDAGRYLRLASSLGGLGSGGLGGLTGAGSAAAPAAAALARTEGGPMAWDDWLDWDTSSGMGIASPNLYSGDWMQPLAPDTLMTDTGWGDWASAAGGSLEDQVRQAIAARPDLYGSASTPQSGLASVLGSLGSFLGKNAGLLGPAASALGSFGGGALGAGASRDAAAAQSAALNRGLDVQNAQWLQQQANQAPWLEAGQEALGHLRGRMGWNGPPAPGATPAVSGGAAALPSAMPGWTPQTYAGYTPTDVPSAAGYAYTPGQGPRAQDYRYTPGGIPAASQYRYMPGSAPRAGDYRYTPGAVPTLSGQELLANDPGVAFRLQEGRHALEASAAARGDALSGPALAALQRQGQELSSQEYGQAWNRVAQQAQMREGWQQYATQQGFGQAMSEAQAREQWAQQASQMGFGQAMSETQLREQVNQIASQQGWSQAQAEAAFREQLAQQARAQNWGQSLQEAQARAQQQQFGWQAGFQGQQAGQRERQQFETDLYNRLFQQAQTQYGRDVYANETDYARNQQAYQQQMAELIRQWNEFASVAGVGQAAVGQLGTQGQANATQMGSLLGQLGTAQGVGAAGEGLAWTRALGGATNALTGLLAGLNR